MGRSIEGGSFGSLFLIDYVDCRHPPTPDIPPSRSFQRRNHITQARLTRSTLRLNIGSVTISTGRFADSDRFQSPRVRAMYVYVCVCLFGVPRLSTFFIHHATQSIRSTLITPGQELHHPLQRRDRHPAQAAQLVAAAVIARP